MEQWQTGKSRSSGPLAWGTAESLLFVLHLVDCSLRCDNPKGAARLGFAELSAIESTVILHFNFAVKQDQELGTELLKHIKSGKTAYISSFALACLMTMARIHRFEDGIMDYLKSSILTTFKDMARIRHEPWASSMDHTG